MSKGVESGESEFHGQMSEFPPCGCCVAVLSPGANSQFTVHKWWCHPLQDALLLFYIQQDNFCILEDNQIGYLLV